MVQYRYHVVIKELRRSSWVVRILKWSLKWSVEWKWSDCQLKLIWVKLNENITECNVTKQRVSQLELLIGPCGPSNRTFLKESNDLFYRFYTPCKLKRFVWDNVPRRLWVMEGFWIHNSRISLRFRAYEELLFSIRT